VNTLKKIYVTEPHLPPLAEFIPYLQEIWDSKILTNGGQFHQQLETELCKYLGVEHLALFTNGTIGLITALQALRITGEVITHFVIHKSPADSHYAPIPVYIQ
jgi:dTDP-4-amino-4,6-dideoxygalactose transaminase